MPERFNWGYVIVILTVLPISALVLLPIGTLIFGSFWSSAPGAPGSFTLENYRVVLTDVRTYVLLLNTIVYSGSSALFGVAIGTVLAWIVARTNTPLRSVFSFVPFIPMMAPPMMDNIAWVLLLSPRIGLVNTYLMSTLGLQSPPFNIYTMEGMIWTMGLSFVPLTYLFMLGAFENMDPNLEEASNIAGAGSIRTLWRVTLPLMRPAVLSASLLSFVLATESFETPVIIGLPGNVDVYMSAIWESIRIISPPRYGEGTAQAIVILIVAMLGVQAYRWSTRSQEKFVSITGRGFRSKVIDLGVWRYATLAMLVTYLLVAIVSQYAIILLLSVTRFWNPSLIWSNITLANYLSLFQHPDLVTGFVNSTLIGIVAGAVTVLIASLMMYLANRTRLKGRAIIEFVGNLPVSMPGMVFGLGLLWAFVSFPTGIYGTIWLVIIAIIIKFLPFAMRAVAGPMQQISKDLEDASRIAGASWLSTLRKIVLPLLKSAMVGGYIYIFVRGLKEISAIILLSGGNNPVLGYVIFDYWNVGSWSRLGAATILMVVLFTVLVVVSVKVLKARLRF